MRPAHANPSHLPLEPGGGDQVAVTPGSAGLPSASIARTFRLRDASSGSSLSPAYDAKAIKAAIDALRQPIRENTKACIKTLSESLRGIP
jgi:hypothetical protein